MKDNTCAKLFVPFLISLILTYGSFAQNRQKRESWRSITPLVSKLQEVEIVLGRPTKIEGDERYYDTPAGERISVWFTGRNDNSACVWNVPDNTVIRIIISPREKLFLSQTGYDLSKFKKQATLDDEVWDYINEDEGILIHTYDSPNTENTVKFIEFSPPAKDKKERCVPRSPVKTISSQTVQGSLFGEYSDDTSWKEQTFFLDNFALALKKNPEMVGFIFLYTRSADSKKAALRLVTRGVRYLSKQNGIPKNRLRTCYRGEGLYSKVVLQPLGPNLSASEPCEL